MKVTAVEDLEGDDKWKGYEDGKLWAYEAEQEEDEMMDRESTSDDGNSDGKSTEEDEENEFVEEITFAQLLGWPTPQGKPVF